jgi:hypothetical protein
MKKTFPYLLFFLLISTAVIATSPIPMMTTANQYYSVLFDEEGEAIVSQNIVIRNADQKDIETFILEIPGRNVQVYGVVQETSGEIRRCIQWKQDCLEYGQGQTCVQYNYKGDCVKYEQPCLKEGDVCVSYTTDYISSPSYQRIEVEPVQLSHSVSIPITLLDPVKQYEQTNLLLLYKAEGYVSKPFSVYKFEFETAKLPFTTENVRVAVNVQDELHLKGGKSNVNYISSFSGMSKVMAESAADMAVQSRHINSYINDIAYAPGLVKTATYLDPHESFSVRGKYAKNWFSLNFGYVLLVIFIKVVVLGFIAYGVKKLHAYAEKNLQKRVDKSKHNFMVPFMSGLFSAMSICLLWIGVIILLNLGSLMNYGMREIFSLLIIVLSVLLTLTILIGVPIYIGNRYGGMAAGLTVACMIGWILVFVVLIFLIIALLTTKTYNNRILY